MRGAPLFNMKLRHLGWLILLLTVTTTVRSEDWREFRGPTGQGHSLAKNLPVSWSDRENVTWAVDIPGEGWSSPILVGDRIFVTTAVGSSDDPDSRNRSLRTICLQAGSGETLWDVEVFQQQHDSTSRIHGKNSHASPTPISDGEFVFVHFGTNGTACLTLDGKIVWKNRDVVYEPRHGSGGSPVFADDLIVVSCDGYDVQFVVALDRKNGDIRWKKERPATEVVKRFAFSTPLVIEVGGQKQIISTGANSVVAYDPADGSEIWMVKHPGYSVVPRPVYAHGLVFICTSFDRSHLLAIRPDGAGDVTDTHVAWQTARAVPHTPSLLVIGDDLYAISDKGIASCLDAASGEVRWTERVGGNFSASPLYADGRIYLLSEEGEATIIEPGSEYVEVARNNVNARTLASYAVVDSALLVRTESQLLRIENQD